MTPIKLQIILVFFYVLAPTLILKKLPATNVKMGTH